MPPFVDVTLLQADTRILVETPNAVWAFKVIDPGQALVEVYGTDPNFKDAAPVKGRFLHSYEPVDNGPIKQHALVKNWNFQVQFANVILVGGVVLNARVEGNDWSYEAIE